MPKPQRSLEEVQLVRDRIMEQALELIITDGYDGFSMRKLANRLGITAKTLYNYFCNQDELYLHILTYGFEQLFQRFVSAANQHNTPTNRLRGMVTAYVEFGLDNANLYNLMFTLHVPKFYDYVGTPMEKAAGRELNMAMKCADFFIGLIQACLNGLADVEESEIRLEMIQIWSQIHGYVAGINNNLLNYMHDDPLSLKQLVIDRIMSNAQMGFEDVRQRHGLASTKV